MLKLGVNCLSILFMVLFLASCTLGPEYEAEALDLPDNWNIPADMAAEEQNEEPWWWQYQDPVLNRFIETALAQNLEIEAQYERIYEARTQLGLADANRFPTIGLQAEASRERLPGTSIPIDSDFIRDLIESTNNQFSVAATLSYELDLWGRVARQREASGAFLQQGLYDFEAARSALIGDIITTYFEWQNAQTQYQIALQLVASYEQAVALNQLRFEEGEVAELELRQTDAELATARTELPQIRQRLVATESAMAALLGLTPQDIFDDAQLDFTGMRLADISQPRSLPEILPVDLLQRRPDLRAAEQAVIAATSQVGVAEADRFPSISLQGFFGTAAADHSDLFSSSSRAWGATGSLTSPLIDFGRTAAAVDSAESQMRQARIQYRNAVNTAYIEVREALELYQLSGQLNEVLQQQLISVNRQLELVEVAHKEGLVSLLEVLDARRMQHNAKLAQAEAKAQLLAASATLYKALGGDWLPAAQDEVT